ncbi:hypothetical protein BT69DRAFT_1331701 [Atractiella rhizophila]|nr:hypothetical protein BT69DRAFT_1331701 [Atractiella rhizophila]
MSNMGPFTPSFLSPDLLHSGIGLEKEDSQELLVRHFEEMETPKAQKRSRGGIVDLTLSSDDEPTIKKVRRQRKSPQVMTGAHQGDGESTDSIFYAFNIKGNEDAPRLNHRNRASVSNLQQSKIPPNSPLTPPAMPREDTPPDPVHPIWKRVPRRVEGIPAPPSFNTCLGYVCTTPPLVVPHCTTESPSNKSIAIAPAPSSSGVLRSPRKTKTTARNKPEDDPEEYLDSETDEVANFYEKVADRTYNSLKPEEKLLEDERASYWSFADPNVLPPIRHVQAPHRLAKDHGSWARDINLCLLEEDEEWKMSSTRTKFAWMNLGGTAEEDNEKAGMTQLAQDVQIHSHVHYCVDSVLPKALLGSEQPRIQRTDTETVGFEFLAKQWQQAQETSREPPRQH